VRFYPSSNGTFNASVRRLKHLKHLKQQARWRKMKRQTLAPGNQKFYINCWHFYI